MAGELAAEWIRIPDGNGNLQKVWIRDSTARRDIAQLQTDVSGLVIPDPSDANPHMDGTASAGSSADYSRADHVHPTDTSRQAALSQAQLNAANSGITAAKVAAYDAITVPSPSSMTPAMDGTAAAGSSDDYARADHVHPTDTSRMPAAKFAFVSGVFPSSTGYATTVSYPTGFNQSNTFIVSWNVTYRGTWRTGYGAYDSAAGRYFWNINNDGIQGYNSASPGYSESWKLLLMRTDI